MPRHASAALAGLFCLLACPWLFAAHPTRPSRPGPRALAAEARPHVARRRTARRPAHAAAAKPEAAQISARSSRKTAARTSTTSRKSAPTRAAAHGRTRRRRARSSDDSFLARSSKAAAQRHAVHMAPAPPERAGKADLARLEDGASASSPPAALRTFTLYDDRGRLIVPEPLRGSHEVLVHQNLMADREGLRRVQDAGDLADLRRAKKLVPLPTNRTLLVDDRLPDSRRYSRPWTAQFLTVLAGDFYSRFHTPLQVNSAVRTVDFQRHLERTNGNAAPAAGDTASPHLTGQAVDIAKHGLTLPQVAWLRMYLQPLIGSGKIDVEEEFQQACFHISVYRSFISAASPLAVARAQEQPETRP